MIKKIISIVVPAYNEEENISELCDRLFVVFESLNSYDYELIIVDNGSRDNTWAKILEANRMNSRVFGIKLSRNFTAPGGITAGLRYAQGDAAVVMCADLQDTPEKLPDLIKKWEEGYDVVYQLVTERKGATFAHKVLSQMYHSLMSTLTNNAFPKNGTVYRIMSRVTYEAFNNLNESNRYFTGLCNWIGFKSIGIEFAREERFAGTAKSQFLPTLVLALNGIFAFSYVPLRIVTFSGLIIASVSFVYLSHLVVTVLTNGAKTVPGIPSLAAIMIFLFGLMFLFLGIIGEYMARIYDEVKGRPNFIVSKVVGDRTIQKSKSLEI